MNFSTKMWKATYYDAKPEMWSWIVNRRPNEIYEYGDVVSLKLSSNIRIYTSMYTRQSMESEYLMEHYKLLDEHFRVILVDRAQFNRTRVRIYRFWDQLIGWVPSRQINTDG